jgi:hypothetical protein
MAIALIPSPEIQPGLRYSFKLVKRMGKQSDQGSQCLYTRNLVTREFWGVSAGPSAPINQAI